MIARLVSKAGIIGGAIYFVINTSVDDGLLVKRYSLPKTILPRTISSIEDIEMYEKYYGCKYIFVDKWNEQQIYNARGFLDQTRPKPDEWIGNIGWEELVAYGANENKSTCEKGKNITLIYQKHKGFIPKAS